MYAILTKRLGDSLGTKIKMSICNNYNIQEINYKMIHGGDMRQEIIGSVGDIVENSIQENKEAEDPNKLVKTIYESISDCFAFTFDKLELTSQYDLCLNQAWVCCNCSNYNFHYYIGGKINVNL
eukprot:209146_1